LFPSIAGDDGVRRPLQNVAAIICGGNVDPELLASVALSKEI